VLGSALGSEGAVVTLGDRGPRGRALTERDVSRWDRDKYCERKNTYVFVRARPLKRELVTPAYTWEISAGLRTAVSSSLVVFSLVLP
jgi:hypothetical protein